MHLALGDLLPEVALEPRDVRVEILLELRDEFEGPPVADDPRGEVAVSQLVG
jgi:hypothetical protein